MLVTQSCLFVTLWTVAHQAPLSMGFSRQEYWSGLLCPPLRDLLNPGIESKSLGAPSKGRALGSAFLGSLGQQRGGGGRTFLTGSERWRRGQEQGVQDPLQPSPQSCPQGPLWPRRPLSSQRPLGTVQWVSPDSATFVAGTLPSPEGQQDVLSTHPHPPGPPAPFLFNQAFPTCFLHCLCTLFHCILTPQFIAMRPLLLLFYSFLFPEKYSQPLLCELPVIEAYCLFFLSFQGLTYSLTTPSSSFIPFSLLLFLCFLIKHCCILLLYPFVKFYNSWFLFYQSIWAHCQILL